MLSSQGIIGIVIGIGVLFVFLFSYRRFSGIRTDTRLHLKKKSSSTAGSKDLVKAADRHVVDPATMIEADGGIKTKSLNVLFMYNGHSFDAHEILGIPAGSSMKTIEEAYRKMRSKVRPESYEFLDTAFKVLKIEHNRKL